MSKVFNEMELNILNLNGGLSPEELEGVQTGDTTLDTVVKARRLLDDYKKTVPDNIPSRLEMNLLINEINQLSVRLYLLVSVLEKKGIASRKDMEKVAADINKATKEARHGRPHDRAATKGKRSGGAAKKTKATPTRSK